MIGVRWRGPTLSGGECCTWRTFRLVSTVVFALVDFTLGLPTFFGSGHPPTRSLGVPFAAADGDVPLVQMNTFYCLKDSPPAADRARTLRRHATDGDSPTPPLHEMCMDAGGDLVSACSASGTGPATFSVATPPENASPAQPLPDPSRRRMNESGDSVPGSQDSAPADQVGSLSIQDIDRDGVGDGGATPGQLRVPVPSPHPPQVGDDQDAPSGLSRHGEPQRL